MLKCERTQDVPSGMVLVKAKDGGGLFKYAENIAGGPSSPKPKDRKAKPQKTYTTLEAALDSWAQKYTISEIDMLWLDMQGHELSVLKASKRIVETTQIIFTEVSFIESYENIPLAAEITEWLENNSFRLVGQDYTPKTTHFFGNRLFVKTR